MKLTERSYRTSKTRPKPNVKISTDGDLILAVTSWGTQQTADQASEEMLRYIEAARADIEVTSPFDFLTCLSSEANYLRIALLIANESLYRGENRNQYSSGLEVVALLRNQNQVAWAQVGGPHILLFREHQLPKLVATSMDLSAELESEEVLPALPAQMLGLDSVCQIQCGHFVLKPKDKILLLATSNIPANIFNLKNQEGLSEVELVSSLASENKEEPFWLGFVQS